MTTIEQDVRTFLDDNFSLGGRVSRLPGTQSLTERGFVDSVGVVEVLTFLETHFEIQITDDETVPENIDTIDNIVRFIERKRGTTEPVSHDAGT